MVLGLALGLASWLAWMPVQAADGELAAHPPAATDPAETAYVGARVCAECHPDEAARWRGSDHDRAMAEADEQTVLGDFNDTTFTAHELTSRFFRWDGRDWVETQGPTGATETYLIRYTFGWRPLQQYLIEFPGGRLQSLGIAWDSRARRTAVNAGSSSIPTNASTRPIRCTGPGASRTGTTSAPSATRPICARAMTWPPTASGPPGRRSMSPARPVTGRARAMSHRRARIRATARQPGIATRG
jgi:hypothetical protein